jgi:hypothetical protein
MTAALELASGFRGDRSGYDACCIDVLTERLWKRCSSPLTWLGLLVLFHEATTLLIDAILFVKATEPRLP